MANKKFTRGSFLIMRKGFVYVILLFLVVFINYPFLWMLTTSFKAWNEIFTLPSSFLPKKFLWQNYVSAWQLSIWPTYIRNTLICAFFPIMGQIFLGSLAAYAFTRQFKGRTVLFTLFLGTMMIPGQATLIPNYVIMKNLGFLNTYFALTVPFLTAAFSIFLIRQYFLSVPKDYEDAAEIDGCGDFFFLFRILMPLSKPALVTVALLTFNDRWNDYLYSLIMITRNNMRTVQVGMSVFSNEGGSQWHLLMAASTFITIPVIILFLFVQKQFIDGVMMSGIKS